MNLWSKLRRYPRLGLILLAYVAFIALGLPDGLQGVGWPSIRADFGLPLDAIGLWLVASVAGYTTSSFLSGPLIARLGVGRVLAGSCALTGVALIGYTFVPAWGLLVALGALAGLGAGAIDAGLNTYVAAHFSVGRMQWLHASWGIGVTLGPIIMTAGLRLLDTWRFGYRAVGGFQIALAVGFSLTLAAWTRPQPAAQAGPPPKRLTDYQTPMGETLRRPRVWLSALLFLLYVGAESALGTWTYTLLTESRQVDVTLAGFLAGSYWATFTVGRMLAGLFARRTGFNSLVIGGLGGAILGSLLLAWNPAPAANLLAVALIGFSIAPIFPAMMSGTSRRVGDHYAANTIGMQMAATGLGAAIIPSTMGVLARQISLEIIPVYLLAVYAALLGVYLLLERTRPAGGAGGLALDE